MTPLGFPRTFGVPDTPTVEEIDGVSYIRLDDGLDRKANAPINEFLTDYVAAAAPHVQKLKPAVIHAHSGSRGYDGALVGLALGRHFKLPVVYEVRGFFESLWTSNEVWSERAEIYERRIATENRCMSEADAVITLSESMRDEIIGRGIDEDKVFVIPNGVDIRTFHPTPKPTKLVERHGLEHSYTFGYISNLDHFREGQQLLVDAAATLRQRGLLVKALIVGDGKRRVDMERYAAARGVSDAVVFTGQVPHEAVLDYYLLLDVFVIPRVQERAARLVTPLKPFEAMAAGIPLVVSDLDALFEIIGNDGERGRSFKAGDALSLADVLTELYRDKGQRAELAERALNWVRRERQWNANGGRYADVYDRVLDGHTST
jgi:glycosyltransferase involved in cell wall biosynthesis